MTGSLFAPGTTDDLENLRNRVLTCRQCALSQTRNNVIFGEGFDNAEIMIIGEAPGRDEDMQGRPFVGLSGQLLDKILDACGFTRREHVYISNIVKCRPPDNRVPSPAEAEICLPWLLNQIEIINPKIMILLGATALKYMTGPNLRITRDHGKWISCYDRLTMPVYHPAALLRDPRLKRDTWEDFKNVVFKYRELIDPHHYSAHV